MSQMSFIKAIRKSKLPTVSGSGIHQNECLSRPGLLTGVTLGPGGDAAALEGGEREEQRVAHDDVIVDGDNERNDHHGSADTCGMRRRNRVDS